MVSPRFLHDMLPEKLIYAVTQHLRHDWAHYLRNRQNQGVDDAETQGEKTRTKAPPNMERHKCARGALQTWDLP